MGRRLTLLMFSFAALAGCSTSQPFETYNYAGIDLGTAVSGPLLLTKGCVVIAAEEGVGPLRAVFPKGTSIEDGNVLLPAQNGSVTAQLGQSYIYEGGFQSSASDPQSSKSCSERKFIVNRIIGVE